MKTNHAATWLGGLIFWLLALQALPAETLPKPQQPFAGLGGVSEVDTTPSWPEAVQALKGAPSLIVIVLDDVGFGQLGCYGGPIATPNIDKLGMRGRRYNNFHTTGLGTPTRAALLTGRNHPFVGIASTPEGASGQPAWKGVIPKSTASLAELLKMSGYNTFAVGKWDLTPLDATTAAGPFDQWPLGMGFERYYGFLGRETDQWAPILVEDNHRIDLPVSHGYQLSADLTDRAIGYIRDQKQAHNGRPFFLYLAYGATHVPLHAPKAWVDKHEGKFDQGWDQVRADTFDRQKKLGIIPKDAILAARDPGIKPWAELSTAERKLFVRLQEAFAGYLSYTDDQIGRLLSLLTELRLMDNTLIVLLSDNGASLEGGATGTTHIERLRNGFAMTVEEMLAEHDKISGPETTPLYPLGWAVSGNTPFKGGKGDAHRGGVAVPLILYWPKRIKDDGKVAGQYHHAVDIMPTLLEALGIPMPAKVNGFDQKPLEGVSFTYTFTDKTAATRKSVQYYAILGSRALWSKGWTAVARHRPGTDWKEDPWELYHVEKDFAEANDLAAKEPDKLRELVDLWWSEASRYGVLPQYQRVATTTTTTTQATGVVPRARYEYYPGTTPVPALVAPPLADHSYAILVDAHMPKNGAEGLLAAQGGRFGGWALFVKERKLYYVHNLLGIQSFEIVSDQSVPAGALRIRYEFTRSAKDTGTGALFINGRRVGELRGITTAPLGYGQVSSEGVQVGRAWGTSVSHHYQPPFIFGGELRSVTIDSKGEQDQLRQRKGRATGAADRD